MSKGSNTTRSGGSSSTRAASANGGGSAASPRVAIGRAINAAALPPMGRSKTYNIIDNYKVTVGHQPAGQGKGGIATYTLKEGDRTVYSGRYRYGSIRYSDYGTARDAVRTMHNDLVSEIMDLKRNEE